MGKHVATPSKDIVQVQQHYSRFTLHSSHQTIWIQLQSFVFIMQPKEHGFGLQSLHETRSKIRELRLPSSGQARTRPHDQILLRTLPVLTQQSPLHVLQVPRFEPRTQGVRRNA